MARVLVWGVSSGTDPLDALEIPDGTTVGEHDLVTGGDVVIGGQSTVEFGIRGWNVLTGERATFGGDVEAEANCRLDMLDDAADDVLVGNGTYLGERVHIAGRLMVSGDLDIGDDVGIEEGFEANGWVVIRNPVPTLVFYFIVFSQLLRLGKDETADELAETLASEPPHDPLVIPRNATISDGTRCVSAPAHVGSDYQIHGNIRAKSIDLAEDNNVFGSLRARDDIVVGSGTRIHGDATTRNDGVRTHEDARVLGDVSYNGLVLEVDAHVDGTTRARGEVRIHRDNLFREAEQPTPRVRHRG